VTYAVAPSLSVEAEGLRGAAVIGIVLALIGLILHRGLCSACAARRLAPENGWSACRAHADQLFCLRGNRCALPGTSPASRLDARTVTIRTRATAPG
jgi:hypothetical protein